MLTLEGPCIIRIIQMLVQGKKGAPTSNPSAFSETSCGMLMLCRAHALLTQCTMPNRPLSPGLLSG